MRSWESIADEITAKAGRAKRSRFVTSLKEAAEENPVVVILAVAAVMTAASKLIKAHGEAKGSRAYAQQVAYRIKMGK